MGLPFPLRAVLVMVDPTTVQNVATEAITSRQLETWPFFTPNQSYFARNSRADEESAG